MARGTVVIDVNRCKGCELCTTVCPKNLLVMADFFNDRGYRPAQLIDTDGQCTGCTLCGIICPDSVITVYRLPARAASTRHPNRLAA